MSNLWRQTFLGVISLTCLNSLGCLYLPYAIPDINHTSAVQIPWPSDDVHVFRVDGKATSFVGGGIGDGPAGGVDESHELLRLQPSDRKKIASQWQISLSSGSIAGIFPVGWRHETTKHTVALRFYRRGYETITVKPGDEQKDFEWKAVSELAGQEKAVDDLIDTHERTFQLLGYNSNSSAALGTASPGHREALRFCADEYDRVAFFVIAGQSQADAMQKRLADKAERLRAMADGK